MIQHVAPNLEHVYSGLIAQTSTTALCGSLGYFAGALITSHINKKLDKEFGDDDEAKSRNLKKEITLADKINLSEGIQFEKTNLLEKAASAVKDFINNARDKIFGGQEKQI